MTTRSSLIKDKRKSLQLYYVTGKVNLASFVCKTKSVHLFHRLGELQRGQEASGLSKPIEVCHCLSLCTHG